MTVLMRAGGLTLVALLLAGCEQERDGACVISVLEPVLTITSVTVDGLPAADVRIDRLRLDGAPVDVDQLRGGGQDGLTQGAGDGVACATPCGFGSWGDAREVSFRVSARGAEPERVRVTAEYAESEGGCPGYVDEGTDITVDLSPAP